MKAPDASEAGDVIGQAVSRSINCELNADFVSRFLGRIIDSVASTISQGLAGLFLILAGCVGISDIAMNHIYRVRAQAGRA